MRQRFFQMTMLFGLIVTAMLTGVSNFAGANTITDLHTITGSGSAGSVRYTFFTVTTVGSFDLSTTGAFVDPDLFLFANNGSPLGGLTGTLVDSNDDISAINFQALIHIANLATGDYILAVGSSVFSEAEARQGFTDGTYTGDVGISIASENGFAQFTSDPPGNTVPEPDTLMLLGAGLIVVSYAARRRV